MDPITGKGIGHAFHDAELLADAYEAQSAWMAKFHPGVVDGPGITKKSLATQRRNDNLGGLEAIVVYLRNRL